MRIFQVWTWYVKRKKKIYAKRLPKYTPKNGRSPHRHRRIEREKKRVFVCVRVSHRRLAGTEREKTGVCVCVSGGLSPSFCVDFRC